MNLNDEDSHTSVISSIAAMRSELRPAERRVADAVLADPAMVARESISALAKRCEVSAPTVVRFSKRVGFSGYPQLRVALAMAAGLEAGRSGNVLTAGMLGDGDSLPDVASKVAHANSRSIEDTLASLDMAAFEEAVHALAGAKHIDVIGIGSSSLSAADLVQKLCRFGLDAWEHHERHGAVTVLALRGEGDVVVGISHSGATSDVLDPVRLARSNGARVIAITSHHTSPLAESADILITYRSKEPALRLGAMASRIAQLTLVDCLLAGLANVQREPITAALDRTYKAVADL